MPEIASSLIAFGLPVLVLFAAALVRSTFGFGDALVAMPLLALIIPLDTAAPLVALTSLLIAGTVLRQDWQHAERPAALGLTGGALAGIPLGLLMLGGTVPLPLLKAMLAGVVLLFALWSLFRPGSLSLQTEKLAVPCGAVAGVFSGALNTPGPFLVIYGSLRGWPPEKFRATLQAFFLPSSLLVCAGHAVAGRILGTDVPTQLALATLPVLAATGLGRLLNRRFSAGRYRSAVCLMLIPIGLLLLADAVRSGFRQETPPDLQNTTEQVASPAG